jgi:TATA-binding protein-associated factor
VQNTAGDDDHSSSDERASVIDHLIFGKPLPICTLYEDIKTCFRESNTVLRHYQLEGISWLHFLQTVNLSGVLCDSMGLGKTLQSLVGVAMAHNEGSKKENCCSLVVCPSTLVGHWYGEIEKYFPGRNVFQPLVFVGNRKQRIEKWRNMRSSANIVVTSYAFLRSDIELLSSIHWCYCILDEGHLLRNPKTGKNFIFSSEHLIQYLTEIRLFRLVLAATACATRLLRSQHKLVLTGTPIQNNVAEIWAIFDFLMPNFLGSADSFATNYSNPITKSIRPNASASEIAEGMKRLKILHQQVLPFILRREKSEVLQELPPKNVTVIRVPMSDTQATIYRSFCEKIEIKEYLQAFDVAVQEGNVHIPEPTSIVLKSLLFLRLLCTHPLLVLPNASHIQNTPQLNRADSSGKFLALVELLREAGIFEKCEFGADNDSSLLYCEDDLSNQETCDNFLEDPQNGATLQPRLNSTEVNIPSKCLIFAQFTRSLDLVESLLFQVHMPSLRYVRLDGNVTPAQRIKLIEAFTREPTIRVMLLTTRVGGLGLNLSCADTVILLESDFNPFADLQAIDRAHRIGTLKTVNVYRLITHGSIEEKILQLQKKKIEISNAIVNTDNSTMHSMGTDRLLDILTFRGPQTNESLLPEFGFDLEGLVEKCAEDYVNLSVNKFKENLRFK